MTKPSRFALFATLVYAMVGAGWILGGHALSGALFSSDPAAEFELFKGLAFVAITALVFFVILRQLKTPELTAVTFGEIAEEFGRTIRTSERILRWLPAGLIFIFAVMLAALLLGLAWVRSNTLEAGEKTADSLRHSISMEISNAMQVVDIAITDVAHDLQTGMMPDPTSELRQYAATLNATIRAFWIIDDRGRMIHDSGDMAGLGGPDQQQRDYFVYHRDSGQRGLLIGRPFRDTVTGRWYVSASRAIRSLDGKFMGVVVAALDTEKLAALWQRRPSVGQDGSVAIFLTDGTLLMRSPHQERLIGNSYLNTYAWQELAPRFDTGVYRRDSSIDGKNRIYGYGPIPQFTNLMVFVGIPTHKLLASWQTLVTACIAGYLLFIGMVSLLSQILLKQLRQRIAAQKMASELARYPLQNRNPVMTATRTGTVTFMNDAAKQLLQSVEGTHAAAQLDDAIRGMAAATEPGTREVAVGDTFLAVSFNPHPEFCDYYLLDITNLKLKEQRLKLAEERWQFALEGAEHGVWEWNAQTNKVYFSQQWKTMLGYADEDIGDDLSEWSSRVHPDDLPAVTEQVKRHLHGESAIYISEHRMRCKDGNYKWILDRGKVITRDADGQPLTMVGTHTDLTQIRAVALQQRESETMFRGLVEQSLVGIYIVDETTMYYANPRTAEIFGYAPDEILGPKMQKLVHPDDWPLVRDNIRKRLRGEVKSISYEFLGRRRDGTDVYIGAHGSVGEYAGKPVVIGVLQDITRRLQTEKQLGEYVARLEQSIKATTNAISDMVELRDPYTAGHERRVAELATAIGGELGLSAHDIAGLSVMGHVHDVGKITAPAEILSKPGRLSAAEYEIVKAHAEQGYEILRNIDFPWPVAEAVRQHHERMDGSGYPRGLKGADILLAARIIAVADVVESMASHRPYRPAVGINAALDEIEKNAGRLYDPAVVAACLRLFREKNYQWPV